MVPACPGADADGICRGTGGNASKMGDTCGSKSYGTSETEVDAIGSGRREGLVSVCSLDSATVGLRSSTTVQGS